VEKVIMVEKKESEILNLSEAGENKGYTSEINKDSPFTREALEVGN
jgi:hypothetical protein